MKLPTIKQKNIALAFLLPMAGLLVLRLISTLAFNGEYSMLYSDCYHQYYPFFVAYRKALLSGDSLLFNWNVGMGMDYLGLIAYYLASPLNLLSVLIPENWLLGYFSFLMPLKLSFASLFFAIFLKKVFGKDDLSLCLFGSLYGLCAWALGYQWNIMWLDTFALLPLVVLGMYTMLQQRKFVLYTVSLFFAITTNYYIGFFVCIFVFLLFFCYEIVFWRNTAQFFSDFLCIALFSVIAIGMSAFLTFPALSALQSTQSSVNSFPKGFQLNITDVDTVIGLLDAMRSVAGNMNGGVEFTFKEGLPNIYCGIITNILVFCYLLCGKISLREKLCSVALLLFFNVSFIIRQLDFIWHGFHFTNMIPYRFSFLYSFVALYMAYRGYLHRHELKLWQILVACTLSLSLIFCSDEVKPFWDLLSGKTMILTWSGKENLLLNVKTILADCSFIIFNFLFIGAYTAILMIGRQKSAPDTENKEEIILWEDKQETIRNLSFVILCGVIGIELIMILINFGIWFPGTNISNYPKGTNDAASVVDYMHQTETDTAFYRAETAHSQTLNDGALNGYNGISAFTSSANVKVTQFMRALGYGAKNTYNRYCFEESSPIANLFLNLKYMIERDDTVKENPYFTEVYASGKIHLLENNTYLPLGFLTNAQILNLQFTEDSNRIQFQNNLLSAATGVTQNNFNILSGYSQTIIGTDLTLNSQSQTGYCSYETGSKPGDLTYRYTADQEGLFCFYLEQSNRNSFSVYVNSSETALYTESYSLPQMLSVCHVTPGDIVELRFRCSSGQSGTINVCAAILDEAVFRKCYDILNESTLNLTEFRNTYVEGTIHCNRDGILYTSIPQDGNWKATVDGRPAQIVLIGNAMIGLNLSKGQHTVTFTYHNAAFSLGWKISLACTLVFIGCYFVYYQPKFKKRKKGKFEK